MKLVSSSRVARVYDDVLSPQEFEALWRFVQRDDYELIHKRTWNKTWRLNDGLPLQGWSEYYGNVTGTDDPDNPAFWRDTRHGAYPSRTAMDYVLRAVIAEAPAIADLIGAEGRDWRGFAGKTFLYPAGSGISWHVDAHGYTGAFAYYAHPIWNSQWGGELMVADESMLGRSLGKPFKKIGRVGDQLVSQGTEEIYGHLDNAFESERLFEVGVGQYIFPKPNRLVILAGGIPHMVHRVTASAGDHVRCSVAGFFVS
jgi:hypothetical protein